MTEYNETSLRKSSLSPAKQALLEKRLRGEKTPGTLISSITPRSGQTLPPQSFAQQRLWFLDQLSPGNTAYNLHIALHLTGPLNLSALERSLNEIVRRHEILRTTFSTDQGLPVQKIAPPSSVPIARFDVQTSPVLDAGSVASSMPLSPLEKALHLASLEIRRPFDLVHGPLLRASLYRLGGNEHIFLACFHHIIFDGWSIDVFYREWYSLYNTFVDAVNKDNITLASRGSAPLGELPIQYADFAIWQRQWLPEVASSQLAYWERQLGGDLPELQLPTDHPRPAQRSFRGGTHRFLISAKLTEALRTFSQQHNATLFMVLLAIYKVLLYRYTQQTDILIGFPIANRNRDELKDLIGFFVNTLVLRTDLSGNPSFLDLLQRVRQTALQAYDHQDLPFEQVVHAINPARDLDRQPLFQVMFALQSTPSIMSLSSGQETGAIPASLQVQILDLDHDTAMFDLVLSFDETPEGLKGKLEYSLDLWDAPTITRMASHYQTLLESILADPHCPINSLPLLTDAERQQILVEWNATELEFSTHLLAHHLVEQRAAHFPNAIAIVAGGPLSRSESQSLSHSIHLLTYSDLNARANQLAHYLQNHGVKPDSIVAVCMERSPAMIVALLGILKAGGAYLPLDPEYPKERLAFMVRDAHPVMILSQEQFHQRIPGFDELGSPILDLDRQWPTVASYPTENPTSPVQAQNIAYIIYTSGSTGLPKGVLIEHHSLLNLIYWHQHAFHVTDQDRATQLASLSFDASVWEIWPYLTAGAQLCLLKETADLAPERLVDWLAAEGITICFLPTPIAESTFNIQWPPSIALRTLLTGGDLLRHYPPLSLGFTLVNNYGPTETTVVATSGVVRAGSNQPAYPSIGRPIANAQAYILDPSLNPLPVGVPGELYIGGAGIARGYLNRPELTAEKFVPLSLDDGSGPNFPPKKTGRANGRLYRTGDYARYLPDGQIEFLGRKDSQVKIRGLRIELGEIEAALMAHPAVSQVVVVLHQPPVYSAAQGDSIPSSEPAISGSISSTTGSPALVAYLVVEGGSQVTPQELRSSLGSHLPAYMLPSAYIFLPEIPLTPNGKIDRRALPAPDDLLQGSNHSAYVAPRGPTEQTLQYIWQQVLRAGSDAKERIGIYDNFFDLGGHSLVAIRLISRLRQAFDLELPVRLLFEAPTIASLAEQIDAFRRVTQPTGWDTSASERDDREEIEL